MPTLVLSPRVTEDTEAVGAAARRAGWRVEQLDSWRAPARLKGEDVAVYGEALFAAVVAADLGLALLDAPPDWPANLPERYRRRRIWYTTLGDARGRPGPLFAKPVDDKCFKAGVYPSGGDLPGGTHLSASTPVLLADPAEWEIEFRCFVLNRAVVAHSPYARNGQLAQAPDGSWPAAETERREALAFAAAFLADPHVPLPPAIVVDVGKIRERGWAVVEANGAWASGIYGCDPAAVLRVLARATQPRSTISPADTLWARPPLELI